MTPEPKYRAKRDDGLPPEDDVAAAEADLTQADAKQQEEYRKAYNQQQRRRNCPGCGDDGMIF